MFLLLCKYQTIILFYKAFMPLFFLGGGYCSHIKGVLTLPNDPSPPPSGWDPLPRSLVRSLHNNPFRPCLRPPVRLCAWCQGPPVRHPVWCGSIRCPAVSGPVCPSVRVGVSFPSLCFFSGFVLVPVFPCPFFNMWWWLSGVPGFPVLWVFFGGGRRWLRWGVRCDAPWRR